ncbi:hypothetical protein O3M35_003756 [Rhynocoris fuscipes]|uniref:HECT-type E3 ubiquitin transferase n=1 Tax=Rhynocoris fuscipes TaxID=488301 RepID=A0AAW1CG60_9HEMI
MYNFDGQYRRSREQNLAGASRLSAGKDELIFRAQKERMKRQSDRKREESAIKIQKLIRGALCRISLRKQIRAEFYNKLYECNTRPVTTNDIYYLLSRITYCGITLEDIVSLLSKAQEVSNEILHLATINSSWTWKIKVLIKFALRGFDHVQHTQVVIPLDSRSRLMVDTAFTFTTPNLPASTAKQIFYYLLMDRYYMKVLRHFLIRIELHAGILFDENAKECAEMERNRVIALITRPFIYIDNNDTHYSDVAMNALFDVVSCDRIIPQPIKEWIIPVLQNNGNFPLGRAIKIFSLINRPRFLSPTLYFFLLMDKDQTAIPNEMQSCYFGLLVPLTRFLSKLPDPSDKENEDGNSANNYDELHKEMVLECIKLINTPTRSQIWINCLNEAIRRNDVRTVKRICSCVLHLQLSDSTSSFKYRIINDLWLAEGWMRGLWIIIESQKRTYPEQVSLTKLLGRGIVLEIEESSLILPLVSVFCSCLFAALSFISDEDLLRRDVILTKGVKPFTKNELVYIAVSLKDVAIGMIVLGYPDSHSPAENMAHYKGPSDNIIYNSVIWKHTLEECIKFVTEVYYRNERLILNPLVEWHSDLIPIPEHLFQNLDTVTNIPVTPIFATETNRIDPRERMGASYDRASKLLCTIPFLIPFARRFRMLWSEINKLINEYQNPRVHFSHNVHLCITIRRDYLYEDAFEKLSFDNAPDLNIAVRVRFTNSLNMDEPGIDGGGIFREFITELLKTAFDPNRGFFILTKDNKLYPNPSVATVYPNFTTHYYFIGRMLAKAIYERVIVDIPLAEFFLAKIIDTTSLYPSLLYSLDNDLFKNISYLRTYNGDYSTLGLDFSTTNSSFGSNELIQLKPNGSEIPVTGENVLEYLHLLSKQKLHVDISKQTRAFAKGLGNILHLSMIQMFTPKEIQLIISGNVSTVEIQDLQQYCTYSGGYSADHANIKLFWNVVSNFTDEQKCQLLKFVTSCSRPPLSGFRELNPPFCIHLVEDADAPLPTASTCMNILKLPVYKNEQTMREKILYAIQSGSGFDLS